MKNRGFRILLQVVGWAAVAALLVLPLTPFIGLLPFAFGSWSTVGGLLAFGVPLFCALLAWGIVFLLRRKPDESNCAVAQAQKPEQPKKRIILAKIPYSLSIILVLLPQLMSLILISTREIPSSVIGNIMAVFVAGHCLIGTGLSIFAVAVGIAFLVVAFGSCKQERAFWPFGFALSLSTSGVCVFLYQISFLVLWTGGV